MKLVIVIVKDRWGMVFKKILYLRSEQREQIGFSQTHKIDNIGIIAGFVFPYIYSFLLYLQHVMLVNMKLDISGCNRIAFKVADFIGPVPF